ncbi:MAG TPA: Holliday junction branch migration protein RuvA [Dinghuibacter sp.]|jgi:Holliday junction DNA helicase RuvA|uniref:Holliday junction branch migration protein RuvA n=1 Tax=Dinghuibacter sp. TaxID=2024697 RepID=UPI002BBBBC40|nr:Holliday junction branch migration protein RuvA [Dinghuibacter sp.]HTJ13834.1 Holliday junction branch migration protein RuvA [Dinghuibacter sp.]
MIAYLKGNFTAKTPTTVLVDIQGVGYEVNISVHTYAKIQGLDKGTLLTVLLIREDAHILYGFFDQEEKELFQQLISVSGVGAATARVMLSSLPPAEITRAIVQGNEPLLERVKGIGKKTAQRLVVELRDKLGRKSLTAGGGPDIPSVQHNTTETDALNALLALGIARPAAETALKKVLVKAEGEPAGVEELIKRALQVL